MQLARLLTHSLTHLPTPIRAKLSGLSDVAEADEFSDVDVACVRQCVIGRVQIHHAHSPKTSFKILAMSGRSG